MLEAQLCSVRTQKKGDEILVRGNEERRKDRFGFVSGTLLVWGVAILQVWPSVAMFQTGLNLHIWTFRNPAEAPQPEFLAFHMLCFVLALGVSSLIISLSYIALRGLWFGLATDNESSSVNSLVNALDNATYRLYRAQFILWGMALILVPLILLATLAAFLEEAVRSTFALKTWWLAFEIRVF